MSSNNNEDLFVFGQRLRFERERIGLTQAQFALKIEATSRTVGKYESGETEIKPSQIIEFIKLGADLNYIFFGSRVPLGTQEPIGIYDKGDVDVLLNAYAHTDEVGRKALMAVADLIKKTI